MDGQPRCQGGDPSQDGGEPVRYRTAEMADAMQGSGVPTPQQAVVLSVVPGEAKDGPAAAGTTGVCDAAAGGDACAAGSGAAGNQPREQAGLETVPPASAEEANSTDSAKTPKVNCEERNTTGMERLTLQILNVSQVGYPLSTTCVLLSVSG